jgi:hypothetical protein
MTCLPTISSTISSCPQITVVVFPSHQRMLCPRMLKRFIQNCGNSVILGGMTLTSVFDRPILLCKLMGHYCDISDGNPFYQSVIQHLQAILGNAWATYFAPRPPGYVGTTRLVDLEEAMNYIDLLENFGKMMQRTNWKSELCKCAAMHSHVVDRALQRSPLDYNRHDS